jgi:hypothetical protein
MTKRIYCLLLKFELIFQTINSKLPKLLRLTKFGLITTIFSLIIATSITTVSAADNLKTWLGVENSPQGMMPGILETLQGWARGNVTYNASTSTYQIEGGLLVASNNLVVETYNNTDQVSATRYMADTLNKAGLAQPVNAQMPGVTSFQPILELWREMRNIALSLVALIGLIISVMILLRVKQGQGYVTLISSLPKLLITIILIISSYSIAGFLLDMGNVLEKVVLSIFYNDKFIDSSHIGAQDRPDSYPVNLYGPLSDDLDKKDKETNLEDFNVFRLLSRFTNFETWGEIECDNPPEGFKGTTPNSCPLRVTDIIRTPTNIGLFDRGVEIMEDIPSEKLLSLIFLIIIITGIFKIFFSLVSAFAKIVIYTIFAPIIFLLFPISAGALTGWFRYFLASSLVFPVAFIMMFFAAIISGDPHAPWFTRENGQFLGGFAPNLLLYSTSISKTTGVAYLTKIISLIIVMMIPYLEKYLMEVLRVPENMMLAGAKESFKQVATKIPLIGGLFANIT